MPELAPNTRYIIPAESPEKARLVRQYAMKKAIYGWTSAVPASVNLASISHVLDVAAGTCVWTADFASIPEVSSRLTKFFPEKGFLDGMGVSTFKHDITQPFRPELHGKFDLIHISFLLLCLTEEGWTSALNNCRDALNDGGVLMIDDADPIMYTEWSLPPPPDAATHDIESCLQAPGWLGKANRIYTAYSLKNNFVPELSFRLPSMLSNAGFTVVEKGRGYAAAGKICRSRSFNGTSLNLAEFEEFSVENLVFIFEHLAKDLFAQAELYECKDVKVTTMEGVECMLQEVRSGLLTEGAVSIGGYFIAKK
ncbi:hypothetical protein C8Q80DRAFT_1267876 [Daedaleopsis nitida]|nr:hypothetical protein C8Q80DRAFT_1267876 [Daedaleopsis nitida]